MKTALSKTTLIRLGVAGSAACFVAACGSAGWRGESVFEGTTPPEAYHSTDDESGDEQPTTMSSDTSEPASQPTSQPTSMPAEADEPGDTDTESNDADDTDADDTDAESEEADIDAPDDSAQLRQLPAGTEFTVGLMSSGGLTGRGVGTLRVDSAAHTVTLEPLTGEACTTELSAEDAASLFDAAAALHDVDPDSANAGTGTCADCVLYQLAWDVTVAADNFSGAASGTDVSLPMIPVVMSLWQQMSELRTRVANDPICGA